MISPYYFDDEDEHHENRGDLDNLFSRFERQSERKRKTQQRGRILNREILISSPRVESENPKIVNLLRKNQALRDRIELLQRRLDDEKRISRSLATQVKKYEKIMFDYEKKFKNLEEENKQLMEKVKQLEQALTEIQLWKNMVEKKSILGEVAFKLESAIKEFVLSEKDWYMKSKFRVRDFVTPHSNMFELSEKEAERWTEWKKKYDVQDEKDFLRILTDMKQVRMQVSHTNIFDASIEKDEVLKLIDQTQFEDQYSYLKRDAPKAVDILAKIKGNQMFDKK